MPASSESQQRLMGMVHAYQKGELDNPSGRVRETAGHISPSDAEDYASTRHKGLPGKKKHEDGNKSEKSSSLRLHPYQRALMGVGVYKHARAVPGLLTLDKRAGDDPRARALVKVARLKLARHRRKTASRIISDYLGERIKHATDQTERAGLSAIKHNLDKDRPLSVAMKSAYPHLPGEKRGMMQVKLAREAAYHFDRVFHKRAFLDHASNFIRRASGTPGSPGNRA